MDIEIVGPIDAVEVMASGYRIRNRNLLRVAIGWDLDYAALVEMATSPDHF